MVLSRMSIDFYDENDEVEVPKGDEDVEVLEQGLLLLPPLVEMPQRAPMHCADVLTVARFVDAFRCELKLPKGGLNDFQVHTCSCWACLPLICHCVALGVFAPGVGCIQVCLMLEHRQ